VHPAPRTPHPARRGFTLVEILVTITILGMMASMLLLAVQAANNSAKVAKTKATITKINHFIMLRYDSYRTRRLALNVVSYASKNYASGGTPTNTQVARARVNAIRDLMRMEMPDWWTDITTPPLLVDTSISGTPTTALSPSLTQRYLNAYKTALNLDPTDTASFQSAKLLYMIVMSDTEAAHEFASNEIGTVDGSGLPVFLDGWGNPIFFLRWPVGFLPIFHADTDLQSGDPVVDHDPFDPHGAMSNGPDSTLQTNNSNITSPPNKHPDSYYNANYAVYPLIYSAGPDGYTDIAVPNTPTISDQLTTNLDIDPYQTYQDSTTKQYLLVGQPHPGTGMNGKAQLNVLSHYDNIHNQRVEAK
jgi:prepilin-type N-terminal cleavage/methylation domain-containing protein